MKKCLQIYSLRLNSERNLQDTLNKIVLAGYEGLELYSYYNMKPENLKVMLDDVGLTVSGVHIPVERAIGHVDRVTDEMNLLGSKNVISSYYDIKSIDEWIYFAHAFDIAGANYSKNGLTLMYHNQDFEFRALTDVDPNPEPIISKYCSKISRERFRNIDDKFFDDFRPGDEFGGRRVSIEYYGKRPIDIILKETNPENISFELDCYWLVYSGTDLVNFIKNNSKRISCFHFKDMDRNQKMTELGAGIIDYIHILNTAKNLKHEWAVIEQENIYMNDKFESIKISSDYLSSIMNWGM